MMLLFTVTSYSQEINLNLPKYEVSNTQILGWSTLALSSFTHGFVEEYEFSGRHYFEDVFGADPYGFWGSQSWREIYVNGDPNQGFKSWWHRKRGAWDFYHVADDYRRWGLITGGAIVSYATIEKYRNKNFKWWHIALDVAIPIVVSSTFTAAGQSVASRSFTF